MSSTIQLDLTDELKFFVNSKVGDGSVYSTADDYIRDVLTQRKRDEDALALGEGILAGLDDAIAGRVQDFNGDLRSLMAKVKK